MCIYRFQFHFDAFKPLTLSELKSIGLHALFEEWAPVTISPDGYPVTVAPCVG